jgi:hypothetical protein
MVCLTIYVIRQEIAATYMHIMLLQKVTEMPFCFEHDKQYITCELRPPMSRPPLCRNPGSAPEKDDFGFTLIKKGMYRNPTVRKESQNISLVDR